MTIVNTKGKIIVSKLDLMGFTPETQVYFIQNGGGTGVYEFLTSHSKFFDKSLMMGRTYNALVAGRVAKFKAYAESKGFQVVEGAAA